MFLSGQGKRMSTEVGKYAREYLKCQSEVNKSYQAMEVAGFDMDDKAQ